MSHGLGGISPLRGCVKGLCLSVIYTASVYLCPAVRKKRASDAAFPPIKAFEGKDSGGCKDTSFIGRVFTSFPLNGCQPVFAVVDIAADYEAGKKIGVKEKQGAPRSNKGAEVPHRTSLDILRVTLNLARGNIEDQSGMAVVAATF